MKRNYQKPDILFEDFAFSSNIAGSCSDFLGLQGDASNCMSYSNQADPYNGGCVFAYNGWIVFHEGACMWTPQENDPNKLCYHVRTDDMKMFNS